MTGKGGSGGGFRIFPELRKVLGCHMPNFRSLGQSLHIDNFCKIDGGGGGRGGAPYYPYVPQSRISQKFLRQVQIKNDIDQILEHIMILIFWQQIMNLYHSLRILYNLYHSYCIIIEDFNIQQRQGYVKKLQICKHVYQSKIELYLYCHS